MTKHYADVKAKPDFVEVEKDILKFWEEDKTFEKSVHNRDGAAEFVFYDGPPFANGTPHYGHIMVSYVKDVVARFQTMNGKKVERRLGWDCHGLPAEMSAEKQLGVSGRKQIEAYGVEKFNKSFMTKAWFMRIIACCHILGRPKPHCLTLRLIKDIKIRQTML